MKTSTWLAAGVALFAAAGTTVLGQQVLAPPPLDFSGISPNLRTTGTNQPGALPLPPETPQQEAPLLQLGPARFLPHPMYRFLYGDGIPAAPGQNFTTAINELYPGILVQLGQHWYLDWTPILRFYSSRQFKNSFDNAVSLVGGTIYGDWTLGFSQGYSSSSQPLIQTGAQTDTESYNTALNATYQMSSVLSLELGANQAFLFMGGNTAGEQLTDSITWSTLDWLNYQVSQQFGAAVGVRFAYDSMSLGSDMTSEQLQGRLTWRPGQKLFLSLSGGLEDRQFVNSGAADVITPIFGVSASYQIFEPTTLSIGATRAVAPAYFADQITETTSVIAALRQRFFNRLFLDLSGGYTKTSYQGSTTALAVNRDDNSTFFNARLSMPVLRRGTIAVVYQRTDNTSNEAGFNLSSSQLGVELGYRF